MGTGGPGSGGPPPGPDPRPLCRLGVVLKGFGQTSFSSQVRTVTFEDVPMAYKPGIVFQGKVAPAVRVRPAVRPCRIRKFVSSPGENGWPRQRPRRRRARVRVRQRLSEPDADDRRQRNGGVLLRHGAVDGRGDAAGGSAARESASSSSPGSSNEISIPCRQARSTKTEERHLYEPNVRRPEYRSASHYAAAFYSKSRSFLKIMQTNGKLPCNEDAAVRVQYIIQGEELRKGQEALDHFYLVRFW